MRYRSKKDPGRADGKTRYVLISAEDQLRFMQNLAENAKELEVREGRC